ncbi:MAG: response regulator [Desulfovibrio sp.]|nr:response regulator [Desulfovibrio sp.]
MMGYAKTLSVVCLAAFLSAGAFGCENSARAVNSPSYPAYTSYRSIPGVTEDEITAVEALRESGKSFIYGMNLSTETFRDQDGEIRGYSALFCGWLTQLFGIPFRPAIYEWGELLTGLEKKEIDFTGELTATEERRKTYFMTGAVAERSIKYMRLLGSETQAKIREERPLRCAFLDGATTYDLVRPYLRENLSAVFVDDYAEVHALLKSGKIDAFFDEGVAEAAFDAYGDVTASDFIPPIYGPVSFTTQNPDLQPVISVVQKALLNGGTRLLTELYNHGYREYLRHKLFLRLDPQERKYIAEHIEGKIPVLIAVEYDNYPVSFYNPLEKQWQGIALDLLREIEDLTGLSFKRANEGLADWTELLAMLEQGRAAMISELLRTKERERRFLWTDTAYLTDRYALLSKSDLPDININEIPYARVGLIQDTAYAELFRSWFPRHRDTAVYISTDDAFAALERGDIDLLMATRNILLSLTNYREQAGYKANVVFNMDFQSSFGFNLNESTLRSIIEKNLSVVDAESIAERWIRKTFDYREKMERQRAPWLIGVSILLFSILVLVFILFRRKRREGLRLENIVRERTAALVRQGELLQAVNNAAAVLLSLDAGEEKSSLDGGMEIIARYMDVDRVNVWRNTRRRDGQLFYAKAHEWVKEGMPRRAAAEFSYRETFPDWPQTLAEGKCINTPISALSEKERGILAPYLIQSLLAIPVFVRDEFWGFVSFDDCRRERTFSGEDESILRSGSLLIVNAVLRGEMEQNVRNTVAKLEAVITNYDGIIWSIDKDGIITTFNGLYLKKIGVGPEFLEGKPLVVARKKNRHLDIIEKVEQTFCSGPQDWIGEIDGGVFHSHTTPLLDGDGNVAGVVGSTDDITDMITLQKDLETAVKAAETASRAKSHFLANMSHEIRTPMNAVIGMTAIGKNAPDLERKNYCLTKIEEASIHLLGVINDILDMSKIEADKFELSPVEFNFEKMLRRVVNVINFRVEEKQQKLTVGIGEAIPRTLIGDDQRLAQVIANLLSNAVKFTPEGGEVRLNTRLVDEADGLCTIGVEVSDTGIGISEEQQASLFNPFQQAESGTSRKFGGTGLGLAISRRIVEMMGGTIGVESAPDKGSTFAFTVRLRRSTEEKRSLLNPGVNRENIRMLAVDDEADIREYFTELSRRFRIACDVAPGGEQALALIARNGPYDIYFVDWNMPGMNGMELTRRIRGEAPGKSVVIMISATEWSTIRDEARAVGVDSFLPKPLFPSAIADLINDALAGGAPQEAAGEQQSAVIDIFEGRCILLVEDVEINREIVLALLEPTRLAVDCAENGLEAVRMFTDTPGKYDMIFMDVQMPEMDGYEATRQIRALAVPEAGKIPIIAMTANVFKEDIEKCLEAGMNGHVGKPLNMDEVSAILRRCLALDSQHFPRIPSNMTC